MAEVLESDVDAAVAIGMDAEHMRIRQLIDEQIRSLSDTGYGRAQKRALLKLKENMVIEAAPDWRK